MLYDPIRDLPLLLTVERFKEWASKQPPDCWYDYYSKCNCALAQYLKPQLGDDILVSSKHVYRGETVIYDLPENMDKLVYNGIHSFGEIVNRAEELLSS